MVPSASAVPAPTAASEAITAPEATIGATVTVDITTGDELNVGATVAGTDPVSPWTDHAFANTECTGNLPRETACAALDQVTQITGNEITAGAEVQTGG